MKSAPGTCVLALCLLGLAAAPPASRPAPADALLLRRAIAELKLEAEAALAEERLPRQETTFAKEFLQQNQVDSIDGTVVLRRLLQPQSKSPFVDAYIRWQLLGFDPAWPADERDLDDDEFQSFLARLPALLPGPRSDRSTIAQINLALARETVSDADAQAMRALDERLRERTALVQNLNRPALELRRWIEGTAGERGHRGHQARLERLHALVIAGWPVEQLKRQIAQALERAASDDSFTAQQRARVAAQATKLAGLRTPVIQSVGVGENNSPQAQFDEAAVYDFAVNEWLRLLDSD